ncbi:MAG TPA: hypothetical protein VFT06_14105, partial [Flavisolibacter sp.]|nr:hypothetical protein [Flavisolibacter sp.]
MNPQHDRYLQTHQKAPFYFHLSATNLFDDILWIERNGIENIQLSQYEPYNIQSLDVLFFITSKIKRLNVYIKN